MTLISPHNAYGLILIYRFGAGDVQLGLSKLGLVSQDIEEVIKISMVVTTAFVQI